jgi:hypothetical protein
MKLLMKLAVTALLASAGWRIATAYIDHYQFRDAVREAALTQALADEQLRARIFELGDDYGLALEDDSFSITREERKTVVEGAYTRPVLLFPGYEHPWQFDWAIEGFVTVPPRLNELGSPRR